MIEALLDFYGLKISPKESSLTVASALEQGLVISGNGVLSEKFFKMQELYRPDYAIEVGAHAAEFSVAISNHFGIKATAFEAGSVVHQTYKDSINSELITYLNFAISDVDGTVSFKVEQNELNGNSGIVKRVGTDPVSEHLVQSYRLDTYFTDFDFKNACLWVDVEGASRQVLSGGLETLRRVSTVFIETEDHTYWEGQWLTLDVVKFFNNQGFVLEDHERVYDDQQNLIFVRTPSNKHIDI